MGPVKLIAPRRFADARGWFTETWSARHFEKLGVTTGFVQDNLSRSIPAGVLRGLHFQAPPHAQAKLVRCARGRVFDVAVDLRRGSPTFGRWVGAELTAENGWMLFIPVGFAHGFLTLEPESELAYKASDVYAPETEGGLAWNDPDLAIPWPLAGAAPLVSDKDAQLGALVGFESPFAYDGDPLTPLGETPLTP
ncbi:MAG: dTDP-4-dehydrorhamnose 3,5-epimerase [Alphaproteobacteria bacterium]|jgi:dTDP-4-dehydrorhamnose 3,5-epimerase|nr:dTDP-4-dehydrorhamnose 3,5-epimerase [Alphaproteobacteria bacterium]